MKAPGTSYRKADSVSHRHSRLSTATVSLVTAAIASAATVLLLVLGVGPAQADSRHFADPAGDMTGGQQVHPGDIQTVTVDHETRLRVMVRHDDLQPDAQIGALLFIDTDRQRPGPELVLTAGLSEGADYALSPAREWEPVGESLVCFHRLDLNYAKETTTFVIGRSCLGGANSVRIALRVSGPGRQSVDWLGARREFTGGISRRDV